MKEIGCVASVEGDAAVVAMPASGNCDRCGICLMAQGSKEFLLLARNAAGASPALAWTSRSTALPEPTRRPAAS